MKRLRTGIGRLAVTAAVVSIVPPVTAFSQEDTDDDKKMKADYSSSVICGEQGDAADPQLAPGTYRTIVTIFNPILDGDDNEIKTTRRLALSFPCDQSRGNCSDGDEPVPGIRSPAVSQNVGGRKAFQVDCDDFAEELGIDPVPPLFIGVLQVRTKDSVRVTNTQTVEAADGSVSMSVQDVPERSKK